MSDEEEDVHTGLIILSKRELASRRAEILNILGLTHREYVLKDMHDGLEGRECDYRNELNAIDFLLDEPNVEDS